MKQKQNNEKPFYNNLQLNRFIIPFAFDNHQYGNDDSFKAFVQELISSGQWKPYSIHGEDTELYQHTSELIAGSEDEIDSGIGISLQWQKTEDILTKNGFIPKSLSSKHIFKFSSINLILFKTKVGFLILEAQYKNSTFEQIIEINHSIKSIKIDDGLCIAKIGRQFVDFIEINENDIEGKLEYMEVRDDTLNKAGKKSFIHKGLITYNDNDIVDLRVIFIAGKKVIKCEYIIRETFDYRKALSDYLSNINVITYFIQVESKNNSKILPSKANFFGAFSTAFDQEPDEKTKINFFRYRKAYKSSYDPSDLEKNFLCNKEIYQPFEGSIWGFSREGVANLFHPENYYANGYIRRLDTYFYLYLLVMHQYYGLLLLAKDISLLPDSVEKYLNEDMYQKITDMRDRINFFYLKCIFYEVSHITHQANFYDHIIDSLGIRTTLEELQYETDKITGIISQVREVETRKREKINDENERKENETRANQEEIKKEMEKKLQKQSEKRKMLFILIGAMFTVVTTFQAIWACIVYANEKGFSGINIFRDMLTNEFVLVLIIQAGLCLVGIITYLLFLLINREKQ